MRIFDPSANGTSVFLPEEESERIWLRQLCLLTHIVREIFIRAQMLRGEISVNKLQSKLQVSSMAYLQRQWVCCDEKDERNLLNTD